MHGGLSICVAMADTESLDASLTADVFAGARWNGDLWGVMADLLDRRIARAMFESLWAADAFNGPARRR